jgi:hypothetical protein
VRSLPSFNNMAIPNAVLTLAQYMAGEFDNQEQAIAEPAWFVHLRLWHYPLELFSEDSITLFAEQANIYTLQNPCRQRLIRLRGNPASSETLEVQYYSFKQPDSVKGGGQSPQRLQALSVEQVEKLPGCILYVTQKKLPSENWPPNSYQFIASAPPDARCCFTYQGETRQVSLGFEATPEEFLSYDKGVDPKTGRTLWGAIMGPYQFVKCHEYKIQ